MKSLKDKLNGNELDLSLCELTEVPVKELAALPKATHLDLSCNFLLALPVSFSTLTYIIHLDLSKNQLAELPYNFGNLKLLQHLDVYGNQLTTLPVSMCQLKKLKWLDLKNNPLEPKLLAIAGDCLDQKQCQQCATKVVDYLTGVDSELEREKQRRLKLERAKQYAQRVEAEKEAKRQKELKKAEKESKKKAKMNKMQEMRAKTSSEEKNGSFKELDDEDNEMDEKVSLSMMFVYYVKWTIFLVVALTLILLGTNIFLRFQLGQKLNSVNDFVSVSQEECNKLKLRVVKAWFIISEKGSEIYLKAQDYLLQLWSRYADSDKKYVPKVPLSSSEEL